VAGSASSAVAPELVDEGAYMQVWRPSRRRNDGLKLALGITAADRPSWAAWAALANAGVGLDGRLRLAQGRRSTLAIPARLAVSSLGLDDRVALHNDCAISARNWLALAAVPGVPAFVRPWLGSLQWRGMSDSQLV